MPIYFYWGEDDFAVSRAVTLLRQKTLDPQWSSFNYNKLASEQTNSVMQGLTLAMTPPFGAGQRLVWLVDTPLAQHCSEELLKELEFTLPVLPESTVLLLTSRTKPDGRLKSTKLFQKHAEITEFSLIPPWKTDQLARRVEQVAQEVGIKLTTKSVELLANAIGNETRQLYSELEKLKLYQTDPNTAITPETVTALVTTSTQSSLQLATAVRQGDVALSLELVADLISRNEPALRIVSTLTGQFRTWLWIKLMLEAGEQDDRAIAAAAEVSNPKRIYFLRQEVRTLSLTQLQQTLPLLLELEVSLKQGAEEKLTLQTKIIELCQLCR